MKGGAIISTGFLAHLLGRYALFLETVRGRSDLAERYYRRALEVDPDHADNRGRYAVFLETVRHDHDAAEAQYRQALAVAPDHPVLLGNFADFLEQAKGDLDEAERCYRLALEAAPLHPNNLTNYATFLTEVRGEHEQAEALYHRALEVKPDHRNALFKYAIFLTDVKQAYGDAELLYRQALAVDPGNGAIRANLAGLLLLAGKTEEGFSLVAKALALPSLQRPSADAAECWFYRIAHGPVQGDLPSLRALRRLLEAGVRSPGFHLEPHVVIAQQHGHGWAAWLGPLALLITDQASPQALDQWAAWREVDPGILH